MIFTLLALTLTTLDNVHFTLPDVLVVLPKWYGYANDEGRWVGAVDLQPLVDVEAVLTAIGLTGLGVFSKLLFSPSIVSNNEEYGPIGVVFIILSWLIGIAVVITGGAIVGAWYVGADLSFVRGVRRLLGRRDRQPGAGTDQAPE